MAEVMTTEVVTVREQTGYKANGDMARDIMTAPATVVAPDETNAVAAKRMDTEKMKRLPVVDRDGRLVGIVSRSDLLRPFLRTDDDIREEIRDEVLLATMWMDPQDFTVTVDQGIVTMHGTVERKSVVPILVGLVRSVAGVVDVIDRRLRRVNGGRSSPSGWSLPRRSQPLGLDYAMSMTSATGRRGVTTPGVPWPILRTICGAPAWPSALRSCARAAGTSMAWDSSEADRPWLVAVNRTRCSA